MHEPSAYFWQSQKVKLALPLVAPAPSPFIRTIKLLSVLIQPHNYGNKTAAIEQLLFYYLRLVRFTIRFGGLSLICSCYLEQPRAKPLF